MHSDSMAIMISVGARVAQLAAAAPDRPMVTCGERTLSRRELDRRSNRLARDYRSRGVKPGDVIVIALPNDIAFVETVLAGLKLGATLLPISPKLPAPERRAILDLVRPTLGIGLPADDGFAFQVLPTTFSPDEAISDEKLEEDAISRPPRGLTSGGSTGRPKIIFTTDLGALDPDGPPGMHIELEDRVVIPGPLYHGMPFAYAYRTLLAGGHVVIMKRFDPVECLAAVERYAIHVLPVVPTMMSRIWDLDEAQRNAFDLSSLRMVVHSASSCPAWLKERWIEWLGAGRIHEFYGSSERIGFTWITGTEWLSHKGSVGRPFDNVIRILDESGKELPPGEVGEIFMRHKQGVGTTYRYIGAEALRQQNGYETVGDMGWVDEDGYLFIADRRVDMIISGGANVYPAEVEAALEHHPGINDCAVIGLPDSDLGARVHAIVYAVHPIAEQELRAWLHERLVGYKIPHSFEFVSQSLHDEAGKLRRSQLRN
ncbi:AMP-binding protein, partial [Rhodopseudomonas palustris]